MSRKHGFTLIELLIVVAIIAILAAIAVPNFLEAQVRSKIGRCKADMRSLLLAAESYRIDNTKYMPDNVLLHGVRAPDMYSWTFLTTPIAYMSAVPQSPFKENLNIRNGYNGVSANDGNYFEYWAGNFNAQGQFVYNADAAATGIFWRGSSVGPDNLSDYEFTYKTGTFTPRAIYDRDPSFIATIYDATNGTTSRGDFFICNKGFIY